MNRGLGVPVVFIAILLVPFLLVSTAVSQSPAKPLRSRAAPSQQETVPAPHWGSAKAPGTKTTSPMTTDSKAAASTAPRPAVCTHTVRSGESISRVAARYRVTRAALIQANQLVKADALRSGQRLTVPGCERPVPRTTAGETPGTEPDADGILIKRVGPRRILTSLVLGTPDFRDERISLVWPVEGPVISTFGRRSRGWHAGIDITAEMGSQVYAAAAGTVLYSGWIRAYGQVIKIQHSNGFITLYAHNQKNLVEVGEDVDAGQLIATVGRSGHATGPHVHFEVRRDGKAYNPLHLLEPSDQSPIFDEDIASSSSEHDPHE